MNKNKPIGKIVQIIGPVVDVYFETSENVMPYTPAIYNALICEKDNRKIFFEVAKHLEPGRVRAISLSSTDGLKRGDVLLDTGSAIKVPVGKEVLGNIFSKFCIGK